MMVIAMLEIFGNTHHPTEPGLKLFEQITYLDEYYLTNAEIEVLETHADAIARRIPEGSRLVELGSGYVSSTYIEAVPSIAPGSPSQLS